MTGGVVPGLELVDAPGGDDRRGWMRRFFDAESGSGLAPDLVPHQVAVAHNRQRGTLRGLHLQSQPFPDAKLVSCVRGRIFDVIVDLRPASEAYGTWQSVELAADRPRTLSIPAGCAHGYLTLDDESDVLYVIGAPYRPELQSGVRWDDPTLAIAWPFAPSVISDRDLALPYLP
jgi:dTDP-4-dehydrorhamnose 3,5-epimerase